MVPYQTPAMLDCSASPISRLCCRQQRVLVPLGRGREAVAIASRSPDSPSQQQIRMLRGPRLRSSVSTDSQNFAFQHPGHSYLLELEVSPVRNSTISSCNTSCVAQDTTRCAIYLR